MEPIQVFIKKWNHLQEIAICRRSIVIQLLHVEVLVIGEVLGFWGGVVSTISRENAGPFGEYLTAYLSKIH
jgi:hypothetical protein